MRRIIGLKRHWMENTGGGREVEDCLDGENVDSQSTTIEMVWIRNVESTNRND